MRMSAFLKGAEENTKQCHSYSLVEADFSFRGQQKCHAVSQNKIWTFFGLLIQKQKNVLCLQKTVSSSYRQSSEYACCYLNVCDLPVKKAQWYGWYGSLFISKVWYFQLLPYFPRSHHSRWSCLIWQVGWASWCTPSIYLGLGLALGVN